MYNKVPQQTWTPVCAHFNMLSKDSANAAACVWR